MIGIIDAGGGMKGSYTAGVYDYLLDEGIFFDYCLGVSAGAANMISYVAGQRGRNLPFYKEYAFRKEYLSLRNLVVKGSAFDLDYIYSTLSNKGGEYPIDYEAVMRSKSLYTVVATEAKSGRPYYFTKADLSQDHYEILKASSCLPVVSKPIEIDGRYYFDGGVSDPIPYQKAIKDGCRKLVVLLTRPLDQVRVPDKGLSIIKRSLKQFPNTYESFINRNEEYNRSLVELKEMEGSGKAKLIAPVSTCGVSTMKKSKNGIQYLYEMGYADGQKIKDFLE